MNIFRFEFKRGVKTMIIWSIICLLLIGLFVSIYPSMKDSGMQDIMNAKLDAMPEGMLEAINLTPEIDLTKITDFMAYCLQYIAMAVGIYGVILGTSSLIKEESEGTIEFLYSKPITRNEIVTKKILASGALLTIFIIIIGIGTIIMSVAVIPEGVTTIDYIMDLKIMFIGIALLGYIFMAVGFIISTLIKSSKSAIVVGIGVFFFTYMIGVASKLKENMEWMKSLSPIEYVQPSELIKNGFDMLYTSLGLVIILVSIIGTYIIYNKKDMRI